MYPCMASVYSDTISDDLSFPLTLSTKCFLGRLYMHLQHALIIACAVTATCSCPSSDFKTVVSNPPQNLDIRAVYTW